MENLAFFQQVLGDELGRFRGVLAAVPAGKLDFKPEPKARSAGELVGHLLGHVQDSIELLDAGVIHHRMIVPYDDHAHALRIFEASYAELQEKLETKGAQTWTTPADFKFGEHVIAHAPGQALMWMLFFDSIHHRGQLSTYLRPMGGKVPSIYGPSADTQKGS
jgi:uncharacterized damage-inducible protein DinB